MTQALSREQVLFKLWASRTREGHDPNLDAMVLEELKRKGLVSGANETIKLNDKGLDFVLHGRETRELVALLSDIEMPPEERVFLANAIKGIIDKPFAYQIINESRNNPNRQKYPSVDLGAYVDVEHGVLFGARRHIMIDPQLSQKYLPEISGKLEALGAKIKGISSQGSNTRIRYTIGKEDRELYLSGADAMKVNDQINSMVGRISALMMKGKGGMLGADGFGNLIYALNMYAQRLQPNGLLLAGVEPEAHLEMIGHGQLSYWVHISNDYRLSRHNLYKIPTKG